MLQGQSLLPSAARVELHAHPALKHVLLLPLLLLLAAG
jgi:hypothetical protein